MEKSYKSKVNYIIEDFKINNYEFHCPKCLQNVLFGIKNKENKIYIKYKYREGHDREILIENFLQTHFFKKKCFNFFLIIIFCFFFKIFFLNCLRSLD